MERTFCLIMDQISKIVRIKSEASTLGELKQEMVKQNIDPSLYVISDGNTRNELKDDSYVFPEYTINPINGKKSTNIPLMLTSGSKHIDTNRTSSSVVINRKATIDEIRNRGCLEMFREQYGKNVTNGKSDELYEFAKVNGFEDVCEAQNAKRSATKKVAEPKKEEYAPSEVVVKEVADLPSAENLVVQAGVPAQEIIDSGLGKIRSDFAGRACCAILLMLSEEDRQIVVKHLYERFAGDIKNPEVKDEELNESIIDGDDYTDEELLAMARRR